MLNYFLIKIAGTCFALVSNPLDGLKNLPATHRLLILQDLGWFNFQGPDDLETDC
jgi:hypothetical protein